MITAITRAMVGDEPGEIKQKPYDGYWVEVILHAERSGVFQELTIDPSLRSHVIEEDLWVNPGNSVRGFEGANDALGTLVLKFDNDDTIFNVVSKIHQLVKVCIR